VVVVDVASVIKRPAAPTNASAMVKVLVQKIVLAKVNVANVKIALVYHQQRKSNNVFFAHPLC
jgi:hypothetical protein